MKFSYDKHYVYLEGTPYHMKDEIKTKLNPTWVSNKKIKGWRFPNNVFSLRELYKFFPELQKNHDFVHLGKVARDEMQKWLYKKTPKIVQLYDNRLRGYQLDDVGYLVKRGSALVLNEPRTGKSPTIITVLKALGYKKNLVVCPSSLVFNWKKEFETWFPECEVVAISGDKKKRVEQLKRYALCVKHKVSVLVISKDTLKLEVNGQLKTSQFDTMVVDEAHFLRNYKSQQSKAVFSVNAKVRYALTGTPAVKHAIDVYGLLHFIDKATYPSYWQFADRYFWILEDMWGKSIGRAKEHREEELTTLMQINSVQRKRKDVMKWLPEVTYQTIPVEMDSKQKKLYDQMLDTFVAGTDDLEIDAMNVLTQLIRLRQLCVDPRLLGFEYVGTKTKAMLEFAENNTDPFIVMTTFSSYFKILKPELEKLGKRVGVIDGSISKKEKMDTAERFQRGEVDILLCNIIAAGTGFTLDKADTVVFIDKDFNPANNEQAQDRIVPTTKERYHPINVISLVVADSIDDSINSILERKEDLTKIINKPEKLKSLVHS